MLHVVIVIIWHPRLLAQDREVLVILNPCMYCSSAIHEPMEMRGRVQE